MNYKTPVIIICFLLSSCSQGKTEAKQLKCNRLVEAMIGSTKSAIPHMSANRAQKARDVLEVFEKNKRAFITTCLKKSDAEINKMFEELKSKK